MRLTILLALLSLLVCACAGDDSGAGSWNELDLTSYNVPVTIKAPDSATVAAGRLSGMIDDIIVKSEEDRYAVQILATDASTNDMSRLKAEELEVVRDNRYFERIVQEEPQGFIFENQIDSTSYYGFRYIVYRGDRQIVFQNTFGGIYDLEETEAMYEAVKPGQ